MTDRDWEAGHERSLGVFLNGKGIPGQDDRGRSLSDDSFLLLFNATSRPVRWMLPKEYGGPWRLLLSTERLQLERETGAVSDTASKSSPAVLVLARFRRVQLVGVRTAVS